MGKRRSPSILMFPKQRYKSKLNTMILLQASGMIDDDEDNKSNNNNNNSMRNT